MRATIFLEQLISLKFEIRYALMISNYYNITYCSHNILWYEF